MKVLSWREKRQIALNRRNGIALRERIKRRIVFDRTKVRFCLQIIFEMVNW